MNGNQAIRQGADAVIAVGGDGTLHEVQLSFSFHSLWIWLFKGFYFWNSMCDLCCWYYRVQHLILQKRLWMYSVWIEYPCVFNTRIYQYCNVTTHGKSSQFSISHDQVVNGFFWAGKPVKNNDREATYSTALGVSEFASKVTFEIMDQYLKFHLCILITEKGYLLHLWCFAAYSSRHGFWFCENIWLVSVYLGIFFVWILNA